MPAEEDKPVEDQAPPEVIQSLIQEGTQKMGLTGDNLDFEFNDEPSELTYGRRLANYLNEKTSWYRPSEKKENGPDLDHGWDFFEHMNLPRHLIPGTTLITHKPERVSFFHKSDGKDRLHKAEYGEHKHKTLLYNVWGTTEAELVDMGVGVAIYFWTLRMLMILTLLAGLISIPNMIHFNSTDYSANRQAGAPWPLKGSAICTDTDWVACPTCSLNDWKAPRIPWTRNRFASTTVDGQELTFILKNNCRIDFNQGVVAFVVLLFVVITLWAIGEVSQRREVNFDEAIQTSTDYSIEVEDPPEDASDPDEWKAFFEQFGSHITLVTVALDNEDLLNALMARRRLVRKLEFSVKADVSVAMDDFDAMAENTYPVPKWKKLLCCAKDGPAMVKEIRKLEEDARKFAKQPAVVSNVFVTFEDESAQRAALKALAVPLVEAWRGGPNVPESHKFRGKHVLSFRCPAEPSTVRWQSLDISFSRMMTQAVISYIFTFGFIVLGVFAIARARLQSAGTAAIVIRIINYLTPFLCNQINNRLEKRSTEGGRQASLYVKMTLFKWVSTAITTSIILPFDDTIEDKNGLLHSVYSIFITEMVTSPTIGVLDIVGNAKRHFFGPRAPDKKRMRVDFRGTSYELSERYTDMTKVLFLTLYYADIYPAGFFVATLTLLIHYWTDKFRLLRVWGPGPEIGTEISQFSRTYFFSACLVAYSIMQAYRFASYPFDNVCLEASGAEAPYVGTFNAQIGDTKLGNVTVTINQGDPNYSFCRQDMIRYTNPRVFPPISSKQPVGAEWMTAGQADAAAFLGWSTIGVLVLVGLLYFRGFLFSIIRSLFVSRYVPSGKESNQRFSDVESIFGYIPQVADPLFAYPVLACDDDDFPSHFIGWNDPRHPHPNPKHNLIYDLPDLDKMNDETHIFSNVKYYPPTNEK